MKKELFLTVGPRGSGKTHWLEQVHRNQPEISILVRDVIHERLFGTHYLDQNTGEKLVHLNKIMTRLLSRKFRSPGDLKLVFDSWNACNEQRKQMIGFFRSLGATHVHALYFVTPLETVAEWFWKKSDVCLIGASDEQHDPTKRAYRATFPQEEYNTIHNDAIGIDHIGFNRVLRINPLDPTPVLL